MRRNRILLRASPPRSGSYDRAWASHRAPATRRRVTERAPAFLTRTRAILNGVPPILSPKIKETSSPCLPSTPRSQGVGTDCELYTGWSGTLCEITIDRFSFGPWPKCLESSLGIAIVARPQEQAESIYSQSNQSLYTCRRYSSP